MNKQYNINILGDDFLEKFYLLANGSVEGAKSRIDKYCTTKGMISEISLNRSPEEFRHLFTYM